jgi:hypothetical protein
MNTWAPATAWPCSFVTRPAITAFCASAAPLTTSVNSNASNGATTLLGPASFVMVLSWWSSSACGYGMRFKLPNPGRHAVSHDRPARL